VKRELAQGIRLCLICLAAASLLPLPARAQLSGPRFHEFQLSDQTVVPEAEQARRDLDRVRALLAESQWAEAVESLRRVMQNFPGQLLKAEPGYYVEVRTYCHRLLAGLPDEGLQVYRRLVDPLAESWYRDGIQEHRPEHLQRLVDELLLSSWGDDALLALGDRALVDGQYGRARRAWERISPALRDEHGGPLFMAALGVDLDEHWDAFVSRLGKRGQAAFPVAFPDTDLDLAAVRARLVLASILEGSRQRAEIELELFRRLHPQADGQWGGQTVRFAERLSSQLKHAPIPERGLRQWTTFAGNAQRNGQMRRAATMVDYAWPGRSISLGRPLQMPSALMQNFRYGGRPVAEGAEGLLSYHPVIVAGQLIVQHPPRAGAEGPRKPERIAAYDLRTGVQRWESAVADQAALIFHFQPGIGAPEARRLLGNPRYTLTAHGERLFARVGSVATSTRTHIEGVSRVGSQLICLDLAAEGRRLWSAAADELKPDDRDQRWSFEGAPICDGSKLYVAMRRGGSHAPEQHVAALDVRDGRLLWRSKVCAADTPAKGVADHVTSNLLTLAEGTVYCNTNLGAVAALRCDDGRVLWLSAYRRATGGRLEQLATFRYRDLNPCLYDRGLLLVAPSDTPSILALDAATGRLLWENPAPTDVVHLLGVAHDRLIASGHRLWWLDIYSGKVVQEVPRTGRPENPRGYGRGLIAGGELFWPTRDEILVFDAATMKPSQEPIRLGAEFGTTGGNLLMADGRLLIVGADRIDCLGPDIRPPEPSAGRITRRDAGRRE